jgi:RNA polymerase sigma-70 factor (ECF subfamily)
MHLEKLEDIELARLSAQRNQMAFAILVERYGAMVTGMARRFMRGSVDADDIAQSTFMTAWRRIETYSGGSFKSWLGTITYREFLQYRRKQPDSVELDNGEHGEFTQLSSSHSDMRLDLEMALEMLSERQRICVIFCVAAGFSHAEAARMTGWPLGTVKSHVNRGVAKIRAILVVEEATEEGANGMSTCQGSRHKRIGKDRTDVV